MKWEIEYYQRASNCTQTLMITTEFNDMICEFPYPYKENDVKNAKDIVKLHNILMSLQE